jgi:2-polyprenyl-3-methyl-5-hydroxy-6-metoxy-1,4-benzoquinol methylase
MRCWICDKDTWHYRKDLNPEKEVGICKECGNVQMKIADNEEAQIKEFYRKKYRGEPKSVNITTTTTKLNYIKIFMKDWLKDKKGMKVADIGAATGYLCDWFRRLGHQVTGTELTLSFRRFSEHFYGIPLTEEITEKHRYDLIIFYHTLEHMCDPDKKLKKHIDLLAEGGHMFISVPEWFYMLENLSAIGNLTTDNYFHKNHLYSCSRKSMQNLLRKCGLEIVKEDYFTYGQTYLVKKTTKELESIEKEDWQKVNADIDKIKRAIEHWQNNRLKEAINEWYNFPDAHMKLIFDVYKKDPERQQYVFDELFKKIPENKKCSLGYATWLYQNQRYEEALTKFQKVIDYAPHADVLVYTAWCLERLGDFPQAMHVFDMAQKMDPAKWLECINWICHCACRMPAWDERAKDSLKDHLLKQQKGNIQYSGDLIGNKKER